MTEDEIIGVFESVTSHYGASSVELVSITGGEPLLRDDLPAIIHRLRSLGFKYVTVQTNGNRLNGDSSFLDALVDAGLNGLGINLDGLRESHDQLRSRRGHFESMCHLARRVLEETPVYLTITTVVSRWSLPDLPELAQRISEARIPRWRLIELQPMGRAHKTDVGYLSAQDFRRLVDFVEEFNCGSACCGAPPLPVVELGCTGWLGRELEGIVRPYIWHCHAGVSTLGIWSNGDIGGCTDIDHRRAEGNVRTDSIPEVWQNRFTQYRDWDNRRTGECHTCDQWPWCHGGALHLRTEGNELSHCPFLLLHGNRQYEHTSCRTGETVE